MVALMRTFFRSSVAFFEYEKDLTYVATPMTGDRGDVVAAVSAGGLFRRVVALNASASGSFIDYDGRQVPW